MCSVLLRQPSDLIDLLLDLQTLKVVELGLMALKGAIDIVLSLGEQLSLALWKETEDIWKKRENVWEEKRALTRVYSHLGPNSLSHLHLDPHSYTNTL